MAPTAAPDGWVLTGLSVLARAYLALVGGLILWAVLPLLLGWQSSVVSSGSMSPSIPAGSILVTAPIDPADLQVGQVLLFDDPAVPGALKSHRMVGTAPDGQLLTRGDANGSDDSAPVPVDSVHGIGRLLVPVAGLPVLWARTGAYAPLLAWALVTAGAVLVVRRTPMAPRSNGTRPSRRQQRLTAGAAATVVLGLGGLQVAVGELTGPSPFAAAAAGYAASTRNPANAFAVDPGAQYGTPDYAAAVAADTPFLFWRLDETTGTTAANSGSANKGTGTHTPGVTVGVTPDSTPREAGRAVALNGTSGCVNGNLVMANPQVFTIEVWFRTTSTTGGRIMGFGNASTGTSTSTDRHLYMTNSGQVVFGINPSPKVTITTPAAYNDGSWHLATASVGTAGMSLYLDGTLVNNLASNKVSQNYNGYVRVGCDNLTGWPSAPTSTFFKGDVDNVAVYQAQLTPGRVAAHWFAA